MSRGSVVLAVFAALASAQTQTTPQTSDVPFTSHDGHPMFGKLTVPNTNARHPAVIYVQTAEGARHALFWLAWRRTVSPPSAPSQHFPVCSYREVKSFPTPI